MRLMAIGAHAADMEFTARALLKRATVEGHTGTLIHMTWGGKGHPILTPASYIAITPQS